MALLEIPQPAAFNCRNRTGCSGDLPPINVPSGTRVDLIAEDADGNVIASRHFIAP